MVVDSSAVRAILFAEPDRVTFAEALDPARVRLMSRARRLNAGHLDA